MSPAFRNALYWLLGSTVMVMAALSSVSTSYADGRFLPENEDAFYHARRILDSLMGHAPVIQFDPKIHAPEGSWVTWPWGFDTLMATIAGWFGPFTDIDAANRILMNIPPASAAVAILLLVVLARQLKLSTLHTLLLTLSFALLPAAFRTFNVGNVDHHFMEILCALGTFTAGVWFFRDEKPSLAAGIVLGGLLGFSVAMQNGLFILQVPICAMFALRWLRGQALPDRRLVLAFAIALVVSTLAACLPSEPFRRGFFEFYTLSWFHLYVAVTVAVFSVLLSRMPFSRRNFAILVGLALVALIPYFGTLYYASSFVTGKMASIVNISEAQSPYKLFLHDEGGRAEMNLSYFLLLLLPMTLLNAWWAWRRQDSAGQFIAIMCVFGLVFLQFQYRFGVFGLVPMVLTPILLAKELGSWRPRWNILTQVLAVGVFIGAFVPTAKAWNTRFVLTNHLAYGVIRSVWPTFAELCRERPGLVLADIEAGHWVRYHTDCPVMANVFLLTPQHIAKVDENRELLMLTPQQLLATRKDIRYVFAYHNAIIRTDKEGKETPILEMMRAQMAPMEHALLGPERDLPPQFRKEWEVRTPKGQIYSRLYEIVRD